MLGGLGSPFRGWPWACRVASRDGLEASITAFTIRHDKNGRPCKWSYDADAGHARYLQRHPGPNPRALSQKPPSRHAR